MGDYGTHPTRYGELSNDGLYAMYRGSVYGKLSEDEKLDLLQETVNRDALERGILGAPRVEFASLPANVSGNAANGVIQVNYDMAVNGKQSFEYEGRVTEYMVDDYNIQALNTVIHEDVHCCQDQIADGTVTIADEERTAAYQANGFTTSAVLTGGSYKMGVHYMTGETPAGDLLYYFQVTEQEAYWLAEQKTNSILQGLTERFGTETSFEAYAKGLEVNGYHAMEQRALEFFGNPDFAYNVNQVLQNQYFGMNVPVDPNIENAVKEEMIASYQALQQQNKEEKNMGFDPKPVTLEEYNQSLRETVNNYYLHALNDPSMSREEAIRSAGEMAEKYLEAVEEFEKAQETQLETAGNSNSMANAIETAANAEVSENTEASENTEENSNAEVSGNVEENSNAEVSGEGVNDGNVGSGAGSVEDGVDSGSGLDGGEDCDDGMEP